MTKIIPLNRVFKKASHLAILILGGSLFLWLFSSDIRPYEGEQVVLSDNYQGLHAIPLSAAKGTKELLVLLGFSGGGTRAAALAYGVLQELAQTQISTRSGNRRLLDEIDVISSVSGGSFTNAYFGLFGDRIFDDFREKMLLLPIQDDLFKGLFNPAHWHNFSSPNYGRSDMAAEYYDAHFFNGKTFADIDPVSSPRIIINASDIGTGSRIVFTKEMFNLLCVDLDNYPISRAVAASSGVPGAATPIAIKNNAGTCGYQVPDTILHSLGNIAPPLLAAKVQRLIAYLDADKRPWLHLVDGGITDNLGLRQYYEVQSLLSETAIKELNDAEISDILMISVNAAVDRPASWSKLRKIPSEKEALGAMTHIQMRNYTADTLHIVRETFRAWQERRASASAPANFDFVEVTFAKVKDTEERAYLNALPTSLQLEEEQVDRLIAAGRQLVRDSPQFQRFLARNAVP